MIRLIFFILPSLIAALTLNRAPPSYEADYKALVKGLTTFKLGDGSKYVHYRRITLMSPTVFPVVVNNDGPSTHGAFIAAGSFSKGSTPGKFLYFPRLEHYLGQKTKGTFPEAEIMFKNALSWMTGKQSPTVKTNNPDMHPSLATSTSDVIGSLDPKVTDVFFASNPSTWSHAMTDKLLEYIEQGGNVILGGQDHPSEGSKKARAPFVKFMNWLGIIEVATPWPGTKAMTIDLSVVPSPDNNYGEVLKLASLPVESLPPKVDPSSIASLTHLWGAVAMKQFVTKDSAGLYTKYAEDFLKTPAYKALETAYIGIAKDFDKKDIFLPELLSRFGSYVLPIAIQSPSYNPELLIPVKVPTGFPPYVDPKNQKVITSKTVNINWKYDTPTCINKECTSSFVWDKFHNYYHSTRLYALPGQVVKVTIPANVTGKIEFRVGHENDDITMLNIGKWYQGKGNNRPSATSGVYNVQVIGDSTTVNLIHPFGGLIWVYIPSDELSTGTLKFEGGAVEAPYFVQGKTTNEEFATMLSTSPAAFVELEIPGYIVFTFPTSTAKKYPDMVAVADTWKQQFDAIKWLLGYEFPRPMRYVLDVDVNYGSCHYSYPIQCSSITGEIFDVNWLRSGREGIAYHEIGHGLQDTRWTASGEGEASMVFIGYVVNQKLWGVYGDKEYFTKGIMRQYKKPKNHDNPAALTGIAMQFGLEPVAKTYWEYKKLPAVLNPNTDANKDSTFVNFLCKYTGQNLVPYFQWWGWTITPEVAEANKKLPLWDITGEFSKCKGEDSCCTAEKPCGENEGDCDNNNQCKKGLFCGSKNCPKNTIFFEDDDDCCYKPNVSGTFKLGPTASTWAEAKKYCEAQGMTLASILNADEQAVASGVLAGQSAWIGANDQATEGNFVWDATGKSLDYKNFNNGEPNNWRGSEDCVEIRRGRGWNDMSCDHKLKPLCKSK